jgi:hypothetical protein
LSGLSIEDAPWIDAIMIPTADRNRRIDMRQKVPGSVASSRLFDHGLRFDHLATTMIEIDNFL